MQAFFKFIGCLLLILITFVFFGAFGFPGVVFVVLVVGAFLFATGAWDFD